MRRLVLLAVLAAVVAAVVRALRGGPAPQFSNHPSVDGGPQPPPSAPQPKAPVETAPEAAEAAEAADGPVAELTAPEPPAGELEAPEPELELAADAPGPAWVEPVDGACPPGYPIKAKEKSHIFHQPGGTAYDRTNPDRCYASAADAEADGFRAAKR